MITLRQATLSRGSKILLEKSSVSLYEKQKIGLVGANGCGKTTLFRLINKELQTDHGDCLVNSGLRISHLSQQIPDSNLSALDYVLSGDEEYTKLMQRLEQAELSANDAQVFACHEELSNTAGYSKPAQAGAILSGLGFEAKDQKTLVNQFSGGWRMRLGLARCLMKPADLLLLDEPTNHLDMEAIFWLERWLQQSPCSIILISHDREFLDVIVSHILHFEQQDLRLYTGNYSRFEQARAEQLVLQQASYEKQQNKIKHMMSFVNRFKAKASKAKQAQSRLNAISKIELIAKAQLDSPFSFSFYPCPKAGKPLIHCEHISVGYPNEKIILKNTSLSLNPGDRIALLGPNGEGKSTFIKALTGELSPVCGTVYRAANLAIGYYAQHQLEALDPQLSPIETILELNPLVREQVIRDFLGGFNFMGDMASQNIQHFSGGEKARLAMAKLVWQKPNLLLLDEPTNHLDLNMRAAIEIALQSYEGALIIISHDRHLLRTTVDDFYLVYQQNIQPFKGDLEDYYRWLQTKDAAKNKENSPNNTFQSPHKEKKGLQNRLKKLELIIESGQKKLEILEAALTDSAVYEETKKNNLDQLLADRERIERSLLDAEKEWMEVAEAIEQ